MTNGITKKSRICQAPGCHATYEPTGNRQKFCPKHSPKVQERARAEARGAGLPARPAPGPAPERIQVNRRTSVAELFSGLAALLEQGKGKVKWELVIGSVQ